MPAPSATYAASIQTRPSLRARLMRQFIRWSVAPIFRSLPALEKRRKQFEKLNARLPVAGGVKVEQFNAAGVDCERLTPPTIESVAAILYLHGGAYQMGSPASYRTFASRLVKRTGTVGFVPDYRLAPEHPYPAAVDDVVVVFNDLIETGHENIILMGDSAGGGLAMALMLRQKAEDRPLPLGTVLMSPTVDFTYSGESMRSRRDAEVMLCDDVFADALRHYANDHDLRDPYLSPLFGDYSGLPPLFVIVGEDEMLLDDSRSLAEKAHAAGVAVKLQVWKHMWHNFPVQYLFVPESKRALDSIITWTRNLVADG